MSEPKIRLDKWLWHARFFKTRTLAAKVVSSGHVRVNGHEVLCHCALLPIDLCKKGHNFQQWILSLQNLNF